MSGEITCKPSRGHSYSATVDEPKLVPQTTQTAGGGIHCYSAQEGSFRFAGDSTTTPITGETDFLGMSFFRKLFEDRGFSKNTTDIIMLQAISNIGENVSSDIRTPWSWLKKTRLRLVFSITSRCLDIGWNTLPRVWYITSQVRLNFLKRRNLGLGVDYGSLQQIRNISLPEWAFINIHN